MQYSTVLFLLPGAVLASCALAGCASGPADVSDDVLGHCSYTNPFANQPECREFRGDGWTVEDATASCDEEGAPFEEGPCPPGDTYGACLVIVDDARQLLYVAPGTDVTQCASQQRACELFAGGAFILGNICGGDGTPIDVDDFYSESYVTPAVQICMAPVDGEPGLSPDGQVCTWQQMSGCTEPGRNYEDYASCDDVRTQRPYYPSPPSSEGPSLDDSRLTDPLYAADVAWVKEQLDACACVCCHKESITPSGAAIFDTDATGNWVNTFSDWGIAFAARAFDSSLLGAYAPDDNNGFGRTISGLPSTDQMRMKAFFERELLHRGKTVDDYANTGPQPAIFASQAAYEPSSCESGEGVATDGTITWEGGRARYVFILEAGSANPGVPPNLDEPAGTLFKLDTIPPAIPMKTGEVQYGVVPQGTQQSVPDDGVPTPLVEGREYLIFALADIAVPMTRCLFVYGE